MFPIDEGFFSLIKGKKKQVSSQRCSSEIGRFGPLPARQTFLFRDKWRNRGVEFNGLNSKFTGSIALKMRKTLELM